MGSLQDVILRGTRADQPLVTDVVIGSLYFVTDENVIEQSDGSNWVSYSGPVPVSGATFITVTDETADLANSRMLVAGANVTLDTTTPGQISIASSGGAGSSFKIIGAVFDGGGAAIVAATTRYIRIPWAGTITKVTVLADQAATAVIDVWKDTYANYPPTDADSITAAAPPTLTAANKSEDSTLTGWTTAIAAGDVLAFSVESNDVAEQLVIELEVTF